jgi:hypothetical protein
MNELKKQLSKWNNPPEPDEARQEHVRIKQAEMQQRIAAYERRQHSRPKMFVLWSKSVVRYAAVFAGILILTTFALQQTRNSDIADSTTEQYMELTNPDLSSSVPAIWKHGYSAPPLK